MKILNLQSPQFLKAEIFQTR